MTNQDLIELGFTKIEHFTIGNTVIYDLGKRRQLAASSVGTANEMLYLCEMDDKDETKITDLICVHNWDYDKGLTIEKVKLLIKAITGKE